MVAVSEFVEACDIIIAMEGNPYERKYKQMNMLGKGNYGTGLSTQGRSTR
jgi:hypothetical protein